MRMAPQLRDTIRRNCGHIANRARFWYAKGDGSSEHSPVGPMTMPCTPRWQTERVVEIYYSSSRLQFVSRQFTEPDLILANRRMALRTMGKLRKAPIKDAAVDDVKRDSDGIDEDTTNAWKRADQTGFQIACKLFSLCMLNTVEHTIDLYSFSSVTKH